MSTQGQLSLLPQIGAAAVETEFVYYATDGCNVKIGRTKSPRRRGGELKVEMLLTLPGSEFVERRHQKMWQRYRIGSSEWFRPDPELLLWLDLNVERDTRQAATLRQFIYSVLSTGSAAA